MKKDGRQAPPNTNAAPDWQPTKSLRHVNKYPKSMYRSLPVAAVGILDSSPVKHGALKDSNLNLPLLSSISPLPTLATSRRLHFRLQAVPRGTDELKKKLLHNVLKFLLLSLLIKHQISAVQGYWNFLRSVTHFLMIKKIH